jgi:hypothetical protein
VEAGEWSRALGEFPADFDPKALNVEHSGKLGVLRHILRTVMDSTKVSVTFTPSALTRLAGQGGGGVELHRDVGPCGSHVPDRAAEATAAGRVDGRRCAHAVGGPLQLAALGRSRVPALGQSGRCWAGERWLCSLRFALPLLDANGRISSAQTVWCSSTQTGTRPPICRVRDAAKSSVGLTEWACSDGARVARRPEEGGWISARASIRIDRWLPQVTFVYRLLAAGTIDEKIFQRQIHKTEARLTRVCARKV